MIKPKKGELVGKEANELIAAVYVVGKWMNKKRA